MYDEFNTIDDIKWIICPAVILQRIFRKGYPNLIKPTLLLLRHQLSSCKPSPDEAIGKFIDAHQT